MVCEVMGRDTGLGGGDGRPRGRCRHDHHPEFSVTVDEVVGHLRVRNASGSDFSIIVVAEGVEMEGPAVEGRGGGRAGMPSGMSSSRGRGVGENLARIIEERTGHEDPGDRCSDMCSGAARPRRTTGSWATRVGGEGL